MKITLFIFIAISIFCSCSSTNKISNDKVFKINGTYSANPIGNKDQNFNYSNFISLLNRQLIKDTLRGKPIYDYNFKIEILDEKKLSISILNEKNNTISIKKYKFVKKEEYLILKNKNIKPMLIPYLAGALDITKLKLNIDENKNLNVIISNHTSGGIFLVPIGWSNSKRIKKYPRIK